MKNQALFSSKDKSKKRKCCLLQFLFGTLRVKLGLSPQTNATGEIETYQAMHKPSIENSVNKTVQMRGRIIWFQ